MGEVERLSADALCWRCTPEQFAFESTDDLDDLTEVMGQERAVEALRFGIGMRRAGYNIYALGPEGIGKHTVARRFLEEQARGEPLPLDWCYVSNFKEPRKPRILQLNAGRGAVFQTDMARFVEDVRHALRSAFESEEYRTRRQVLEEEIKERQEHALEEIEEDAKARGIALMRTPVGFAFAPVAGGKVISPEVFQRLAKKDRERIETDIEALQKRLHQVLREAPRWMKELRDQIRELSDQTAIFAVGHLSEELRKAYADQPEILAFLDEVQQDVVRNVETIAGAQEKPGPDGVSADFDDGHPVLRRYRVNLLVDNGGCDRAPVVYEDDPSFDRLRGRIEHRAEMGALLTDFHMIRPGVLHRANGGYLIVDARKILARPMAWEGLKQALMTKEIRIEPLAQALGVLSTVTLEPEPIPLEVKVVMVGDRTLYYLLSEHDPEFGRLFKVAADFDERVERGDENNLLYARLVATLVRKDELKSFDSGAVARVLEYSARQAGDAEKLSTQIEGLSDVLREADYWAARAGRAVVGAEDVQRALDSRIHRLDRVREQIQEQIERGTIVIDTEGATVGQINALSIMQLGGFAFGRPNRVTARVRLGRGEVVDIEREVELGGPLHSKGVLILSGYLSAHYASDRPLSLGASLVFEQSYGGIDGDSASSAELYALLSAIAEVPIAQSFAVTGSVNQRGEVQAIGGVNEKIEGFFDLCAARGLSGKQGVLIPATNVKHLMLHARVVDAVEAGKFDIYPVATIDQGLEILTGVAAGARGPDGRFPEGTVNRRVEAKLLEMAEKRQAFARAPGTEGGA
ncbi:MAG: AAA family ATPase [Proteobacteria bacterium]|nr:AAA family ATPase [Pseudomonadota bacterium]